MPTKYTAQGTTWEVEIASVWTAIGCMRSVDFPVGEVQFWDGTCLDSGVGIEDGELANQTTPGEAGGEIFYDPADPVHSLLAADPESGGVHRQHRITMPDTGSSVCTFEGAVKSFAPKSQTKEGFLATLSVKLRSPAAYPAAT